MGKPGSCVVPRGSGCCQEWPGALFLVYEDVAKISSLDFSLGKQFVENILACLHEQKAFDGGRAVFTSSAFVWKLLFLVC